MKGGSLQKALQDPTNEDKMQVAFDKYDEDADGQLSKGTNRPIFCFHPSPTCLLLCFALLQYLLIFPLCAAEFKVFAKDLVELLRANAVKVPYSNVVSDDMMYKGKIYEQLSQEHDGMVPFDAYKRFLQELSGESNWACSRMKLIHKKRGAK